MASETPRYELSTSAKAWAAKRRQKVTPARLKELLSRQRERCALSGAPLLFDRKLGTPQKGGHGVHPLYPAVDHLECGNAERGYQIVCYALNDVKGHMPFACFEALKNTDAWKAFMQRWCLQAMNDPQNREALRELIFPNDSRKNGWAGK
jgi:hypothetical protein